MSKHNEYIQQIADRLAEQIKENKAPWQKPFDSANFEGILPVNVDGRPYRGTNLINLMSAQEAKGYKDTRWLTFLAAKNLGAKVKKGEKGTPIHYWKFHEERYKRDDDGNKVLDDKGRAIKEKVVLDRPRVFYATVFNAEQIEGLPEKTHTIRPIEAWDRHERCERIVANSGIDIIHKPSDAAYYSPKDDHIVMPERSQFATADLYYATLLHEIGHSTGHENRLNRDLTGGFGSESYAREELRAEIASMMLGQELQIGHDPGQHIAYLESWSKIVKDDPKAIFYAVKDADAISKYVLSLDPELKKDAEQEVKTSKLAEVATKAVNTKTYLFVPYEEKDEAKALGARWDKSNKSWYAPAGMDLNQFSKWLNEPSQSRNIPSISAEEEVAKFLESKGCVIKPGHPKLDGRFHRLHIAGDKSGSLNGSYVIHTDNGIPRGYFRNFKTGEEEKFISEQRDTPQGRAIANTNIDFDKIKAAATAKLQAEYNMIADIATKIYDASLPVHPNHSYLTNKEISSQGVMAIPPNNHLPDELKDKIVIGADWREAKDLRKNPEEDRIVLTQGDILLPVQNKAGEIRTLQTIAENGFKSFLKGGEKSGNYTTIGSIEANKPFIIVEGWATGKTIHEQAGIPVVVAFDKNNLLSVAEIMREQHPDSRIYIGADNDHQQEAKYIEEGRTGPGGELNPGKEAAAAAAEKIDAYVLTPKFSAEDKGSDWNDVFVDKGLNEFKSQMREQVLSIKLPEIEIKTNQVDVTADNSRKVVLER